MKRNLQIVNYLVETMASYEKQYLMTVDALISSALENKDLFENCSHYNRSQRSALVFMHIAIMLDEGLFYSRFPVADTTNDSYVRLTWKGFNYFEKHESKKRPPSTAFDPNDPFKDI